MRVFSLWRPSSSCESGCSQNQGPTNQECRVPSLILRKMVALKMLGTSYGPDISTKKAFRQIWQSKWLSVKTALVDSFTKKLQFISSKASSPYISFVQTFRRPELPRVGHACPSGRIDTLGTANGSRTQLVHHPCEQKRNLVLKPGCFLLNTERYKQLIRRSSSCDVSSSQTDW